MSKMFMMSQHQNLQLSQLTKEKEMIKRHRYDLIKMKNQPKPDYRLLAKKMLPNTPSQVNDNIVAYKELDSIQIAARNILELGLHIAVPTDVSNCACVHLYTFFQVNSIEDYELV